MICLAESRMALPALSDRFRGTLARGRGHLWVLLILFGIGYLSGIVYHFAVWASQTPAAPAAALTYHVTIILSYVLLFVYLSRRVREFRTDPASIFWTILLVAIGFSAFAGLLAWVSDLLSPDVLVEAEIRGFEFETGVPLTPATVVKMNLVALMETSFAFLLLVMLRELVHFKRTRRSLRNWTLMLVMMAVTSLLSFMRSPQEELSILQGIALLPTVGLMVTNSFRLSWVVYLSFKQKMAIIGLSLLLLAGLAVGMASGGDEGFLPRAAVYLQHYSYPLGTFTLLVSIFAILYSLTALLSLIFHLPTTGDFQRKTGEMAAMHSLTTLVSQVFEPERLFASITDSPVEAGTAQVTWLAMRNSHSGSLKANVVSSTNITLDNITDLVDVDALFEEVIARGEPLVLEEAGADHRVSGRTDVGIGSLLVVPLISLDMRQGALFAARDVSHGFEEDEIEALTAFAAQAALALENARLVEQKVEKERLVRELSIAREVQQRLLPQRLPDVPGLSLAASSVSAQEVGGDYFDLVYLDDDRLAFIVADVSGKGTSAAFYMAELQGIFHTLAPLLDSPVEFLVHANRALAKTLERHVFVSAIYGIIDVRNEQIVMARAGHCPAATISLNGRAQYIRPEGLGLGLDRTDRFRHTLTEERLRLNPGDVFMLYTDGIVESRSDGNEEFGYERLLESMSRHRHEDADVLHDKLLEDLHAFLGHRRYDDDLTLLVMKWSGVTTALPESAEDSNNRSLSGPVEVKPKHVSDIR